MDAQTVWRNVALKLEIAESAAVAAQDLMDRLLNVPHISENLSPHIEALGRFHKLATEKVQDA